MQVDREERNTHTSCKNSTNISHIKKFPHSAFIVARWWLVDTERAMNLHNFILCFHLQVYSYHSLYFFSPLSYFIAFLSFSSSLQLCRCLNYYLHLKRKKEHLFRKATLNISSTILNLCKWVEERKKIHMANRL